MLQRYVQVCIFSRFYSMLTSRSADVGIAMGSGSDIAITNAKFILMSSSLMSILTLMELSRTVMRRIKFNFLWYVTLNHSFAYDKLGLLYIISLEFLLPQVDLPKLLSSNDF